MFSFLTRAASVRRRSEAGARRGSAWGGMSRRFSLFRMGSKKMDTPLPAEGEQQQPAAATAAATATATTTTTTSRRQSTEKPPQPKTYPRPPHTAHLSKHPQYPARGKVTHVPWTEPDEAYAPVEFTHASVLANDRNVKPSGWADPADPTTPEMQAELAKRTSNALYVGGPLVVVEGRPLHPFGRTGMTGRGLLGKWGPNFAADPLVTRWGPAGALEMVAIQRADTKAWAIPGGMVDAGELVSVTLRREFLEEAGNIPDAAEKADVLARLNALFASGGSIVYMGMVDDARATDNAWIETTCAHFHIDDAKLAEGLPLAAGDDAVNVRWMRVAEDSEEFKKLYASHHFMVLEAVKAKASSLPEGSEERKRWEAVAVAGPSTSAPGAQ